MCGFLDWRLAGALACPLAQKLLEVRALSGQTDAYIIAQQSAQERAADLCEVLPAKCDESAEVREGKSGGGVCGTCPEAAPRLGRLPLPLLASCFAAEAPPVRCGGGCLSMRQRVSASWQSARQSARNSVAEAVSADAQTASRERAL